VVRGSTVTAIADASVHRHSGTTDGLAEIVGAVRPDVVFHLASRFVAEHHAADVEPLVRDNLLFGAQLLDAMRATGVTGLVNAGSAWQHFHNAEYSPVNLYAATKQAFADLIAFYVPACGMRAVTLELTDTYGPNDERRKLIPIMRDAEREGRELSMVNADMPLDFVHVSDAVEACVVAAARVRGGSGPLSETFAVRSGVPTTVRSLFDTWERARGKRVAARFGERPYREREMIEPWTQGTVLPGWTPAISLEDGLRAL
jgi:nucleoside-diphosphate-sugar epimerase